MKNLDLENLDLEPHDREVKISISSRKLKKVSRRSVDDTLDDDNVDLFLPITSSGRRLLRVHKEFCSRAQTFSKICNNFLSAIMFSLQ